MQTAANTNRFLTGCSSKAEFADSEIVVGSVRSLRNIIASQLAQTVHSQEAFLRLANRLIYSAEQFYMVRDVDALQEVTRVLMNLPIDGALQIGLYYHALAINRKGQTAEAEGLLATVADNAPAIYRARAIQTLGTNNHAESHLDEALRFQLEALRLASDRNAHSLQTTLLAHLEISHIKSDTGDHKGALEVLEGISPLVQIISRQSPLYFYFYHNELAVEFGELNRIADAQAASSIALACPVAQAYPEWRDTRDEIAAKRLSASKAFVAINRASNAQSAIQVEPQRAPKPSQVVSFVRPANDYDLFQRSTIEFPAKPIVVLMTASILDRMLICIGPRAPPAHS